MAESEATETGSGEAPASNARLLLNTHYVRDLSFENPNAPMVYADLPSAPTIDVTVNVDVRNLQERLFEVVLSMRVKAHAEELTVFLVELDFAGLATVGDAVPEPEVEKMLLIDVPRFLFPFARAVVSDVTRDGGFPPLLINPIDFEDLYESRQARDAELAQSAGQ
ncbi:MAG: protein-export chaperone SecB [Kiloniellales bacterium]|nr:protein-export chaperone SecB [Kiloniellales bacterium]